MSDNTKIEWTDATWNPITGCSVVSAGCKHCYAMKLAGTRLRNHPSRAGLTIDTKAGPVWNGQVRLNMEWLLQPIDWKRPRRIFVCAHGDLFHENVPDSWLSAIFGIMAESPQHTFQVLTKRPERALRWFGKVAGRERDYMHEGVKGVLGYHHPRRPPVNNNRWPLPNVWIGVSVEDQAAADERIPALLAIPAAVRFLSCEPLLGPVNLRRLQVGGGWYDSLEGWRDVPTGPVPEAVVDWVIAGGESGHGARDMNPEWARSLMDQCERAGVAFFMKQMARKAPIPNDLFVRGFPKAA